MIRASAPGRCGICGNPTDGYGGTVISSSLSERAMVELVAADRVRVDVCNDVEELTGPADLRLTNRYTDVVKAVCVFVGPTIWERPFHLTARTHIPMMGGLAGSTAMIAAITGAIFRHLGIFLNRYEIAETIRKIEFDILKCVCGFQDQYMTCFGGLNYIDFRDKDPHTQVAPVFATVEPLEHMVADLPLLLANTGVQHHSGQVHMGLRERWIQGDPVVVQGYERCARLAREAKQALLAEDWRCLGERMNENHAIQRDLGGSGDSNERLIRAALDAGAFGAKLAGAGKGGTIIALHEDLDYLERRLTDAGAARILRVTPSEGLVVESEY